MGLPDEFKEKRPITIGFVVWVGVICFSLGGTAFSIMGLDQRIVDEVGGLRADWERHNIELERQHEHQQLEIEQMEKRFNEKLNQKMDYHEAANHNREN